MDYTERATDLVFTPVYTRLMALNDDLTLPRPSRLVGRYGPYDFSTTAGVTDASAVPIIVKIGSKAEEILDVDIGSASSDVSAVTTGDLAAALNAAFTSGSLALTASVETKTGRIHVASTDLTNVKYLQLYGLCAEIAKFGQGFGAKYVKRDTVKSFNTTLEAKDNEDFTETDGNGRDWTVTILGHPTGFSGTLVDTTNSFEMRDLIQGGSYFTDDRGDTYYQTPTRDDEKNYFLVEMFSSVYVEQENLEKSFQGYYVEVYPNCVGSVTENTRERGINVVNYNITGKNYRSERRERQGCKFTRAITKEEYAILDVHNV